MAEKCKCDRCNRGLSDPKSIERNMGPVCYEKSGGGIFDADMLADDREWTRREEVLKHGGEIDLGVNWDYPDPGNLIRGYQMRVSVRYKDGAFEAYGALYKPGQENQEVVFSRGSDIKDVYGKAVAAGPSYTAKAYQTRKCSQRKAMKAMKKAS